MSDPIPTLSEPQRRHGGPPRNEGKWSNPQFNQARKIIAKFGGEPALAKAIGISRISAYRWNYRRPYGTDGLVPSRMIDRVKQAARVEGIILTPEDWTPERIMPVAVEETVSCSGIKSLMELLS